MSHSPLGGTSRKLTLATGLWITAAMMVVAGFILRLLASLLSLSPLRYGGIAVLALGLAVAVLGWVSERLSADRPLS